jgi:hypothetical protein
MFTKTLGMKCTNEGCSMKGKLVGPRVTTCKECARRTEPEVSVNQAAVVAACAVAALILAGGGYYWYKTQKLPPSPQPIASGTPTLSYAIQMEDGGFRNVPETAKFRSGDKFRLLVKTGFQAYVYCFHEDSATGEIDTLSTGSQPLDVGLQATVPSSGTIHMDTQPAPEKFTLIASANPLRELEFSGGRVTRTQFQSIADRMFQKNSETTTTDGGWTVVESKSKGATLLRAIFTLKHE